MAFRRVLASISTLLLASSGGALAQDQSGVASAGQDKPDTLTCAQVVALDTATVPGVLYFISGYSQGKRDSASAIGAAASASNAEETSSTDGENTSETVEATSSASDNAESTANDTTGTTSASEDNMDATTTGETPGTPQVGTVTGYFEIPVEQLLVACETSPDSPVSDMLDEEGKRQGATGLGAESENGDPASSDMSTDDDTSTSQ